MDGSAELEKSILVLLAQRRQATKPLLLQLPNNTSAAGFDPDAERQASWTVLDEDLGCAVAAWFWVRCLARRRLQNYHVGASSSSTAAEEEGIAELESLSDFLVSTIDSILTQFPHRLPDILKMPERKKLPEVCFSPTPSDARFSCLQDLSAIDETDGHLLSFIENSHPTVFVHRTEGTLFVVHTAQLSDWLVNTARKRVPSWLRAQLYCPYLSKMCANSLSHASIRSLAHTWRGFCVQQPRSAGRRCPRFLCSRLHASHHGETHPSRRDP